MAPVSQGTRDRPDAMVFLDQRAQRESPVFLVTAALGFLGFQDCPALREIQVFLVLQVAQATQVRRESPASPACPAHRAAQDPPAPREWPCRAPKEARASQDPPEEQVPQVLQGPLVWRAPVAPPAAEG